MRRWLLLTKLMKLLLSLMLMKLLLMKLVLVNLLLLMTLMLPVAMLIVIPSPRTRVTRVAPSGGIPAPHVSWV